ncbi:class I SAM-dependent methyltransferase [Nitrospira moscoviensis]|uniref:Putative Methyltransferase type 11 n=1 Tax=Nitrospira moscoviensis TaxID=42253 RepID=A0A0K2GGM5_NITMO|nr:class I SAM-dependent methyltransferase [Nitrospira moscoviensis]ALA59772.1 putative Methyltransferase type 11 [Nitrospira moscoviensis]
MSMTSAIRAHFSKVRERSWEICRRYYGDGYLHHNERYRQEVLSCLTPNSILLDAGAGEMQFTAEFAPKVRLAIATDMGELKRPFAGIMAVRSNLENLPFKDGTVDAVISMSVVEHLDDPDSSFREMARVLKPGGRFIAQTPSKFDYVSLAAHYTPFRFHRWLLSRLLDRREEDIFPTRFKANTVKSINACLAASALIPRKITFFNQYPAYLMFSPLLFRVGVLYERLTSKYERLAQLRGWVLIVAEKPSGEDMPSKSVA